ncbi:MAG: STAS domain-containing protein [Actinobacteria bacterium]|nr:STAS domain-containing protein [Actinomycetota bacterium]
MHVVVRGEVDAANAGEFESRVCRCIADHHELVLDLTGVEFFAVEAFATLKHIQSCCHRAGARWVLVPSAAVARVMRLCDRDRCIPCAATPENAFCALRPRTAHAVTA